MAQLSDKLVADLEKKLANDKGWLAEKARVEAKTVAPRRRARKVREALERFALRRGLVDQEVIKEVAAKKWLRPINYDDRGIV